MACCRKNVPLRGLAANKIDDGTMCRAQSPLPGPLRGIAGEMRATTAVNFSDVESVLAMYVEQKKTALIAEARRKTAAAIGNVA